MDIVNVSEVLMEAVREWSFAQGQIVNLDSEKHKGQVLFIGRNRRLADHVLRMRYEQYEREMKRVESAECPDVVDRVVEITVAITKTICRQLATHAEATAALLAMSCQEVRRGLISTPEIEQFLDTGRGLIASAMRESEKRKAAVH